MSHPSSILPSPLGSCAPERPDAALRPESLPAPPRVVRAPRVARGAFTLVEMLIVISIISVLLGMLYGALERARKFSRRTIAYAEVKGLETSFKQYYAHYHMWPSNALANMRLTSADGRDTGFIIDRPMADLLQGIHDPASQIWRLNPEAIPFIEFSRFCPISFAPVNPFKPNRSDGADTTRRFKILFDTNGDNQILIPFDSDAPGSPTTTNVVATVAAWTVIPGTQQSSSSGRPQNSGDIRIGSWESFGAR